MGIIAEIFGFFSNGYFFLSINISFIQLFIYKLNFTTNFFFKYVILLPFSNDVYVSLLVIFRDLVISKKNIIINNDLISI